MTMGVLLLDEPDMVKVCFITPVKSFHSRASRPFPEPELVPDTIPAGSVSDVFPANNADGAATAAAVSSPAFRMKSLRVVFSMSDFA